MRPSLLLKYNGRNVLIDCGPDFRTQALRAKIDRLDAILFTHAHADHILGLDDVRPFNFRQKEPIPIFGSRETIATIRQVFRYIFENLYTQTSIPKVETHTFDGNPFDLFGVEITPIPAHHGRENVLGFRFGSAAYLTDHSDIPETSQRILENLDVLFVDGLRHRDHPTHSTVKQAMEYNRRLRPRRMFLTHMSHELGHAETERGLPPSVALSYDGLRLDVSQQPPPKIFRGFGDKDRPFGPCVLAIGNFDGVHRGHLELMRKVTDYASFHGVKSAVLTFDPHPSKIVAPERTPRLITTIEERCRLIGEAGIQQIMILPFDREVSRLTAEEFVESVLMARLRVHHIIVGEDFRFGCDQSGNVDLLAKMARGRGFTIEAIRKVDCHHHQISSSGIRRFLDRGRVGDAMHDLGRPYAVEGEVVTGHGIGSKHTVPTLNISWTAEIIPARGVYVTRTREIHSARTWPSVTNIGFRPTFEGEGLTIETFLLEPLEEHTPRSIRIEFLYHLREERKFDGPASLKEQILRDVSRARAYHRRFAKWTRKDG